MRVLALKFPAMLATANYYRKSLESDERQVQSLEDQNQELSSFVTRFNQGFARNQAEQLEVVDTFSESCSAKRAGQREVFNQMIEQAETGKYDCILVWAIDRLSRNVGDIERIITLLESGKLKLIRTPSQEFRNDPFHKYMLVQAVANAKLENDQRGVNILRGMKGRVKEGHWVASARLGYVNRGEKKGQKWTEPDSERWSIIIKSWKLFATGSYSVMEIHRQAAQMGLRAKVTKKTPVGSLVSKNTFYSLFRDVFYMGKMRIGNQRGVKLLTELKLMIERGELVGEVYEDHVILEGKHPAMVSEDLFYRVQDVLKERGQAHYAKPRSKLFIFSGMIECGECGCAVVCEDKTRYKCSHCSKWFTSNAPQLPSHCSSCHRKLSKKSIQTTKYHAYAHCSGKNPMKKACVQTYYKTGKGKPSVPLNQLESQVDEYLSRLTIGEKEYEYCLDTLKSEHFQNKILKMESLKSLQAEQRQLEAKLDSLVDMRMNKELDADTFQTKQQKLKFQKKQLQKKLEKWEQKNKDWVAQTEDFLNMASQARFAFKNGNLDSKREILKSVSSHIFLSKGKLEFKLRKPFDVLLIPDVDESPKKQSNTALAALFPNWYSRLEQVSIYFLNHSDSLRVPKLAA